MYNEYLENAEPNTLPQNIDPIEPQKTAAAGTHSGGLGQLLANRIGGIKLDMNTLIALGVIWFLLSDGTVVDTDLLIIIGVLLLLGV